MLRVLPWEALPNGSTCQLHVGPLYHCRLQESTDIAALVQTLRFQYQFQLHRHSSSLRRNRHSSLRLLLPRHQGLRHSSAFNLRQLPRRVRPSQLQHSLSQPRRGLLLPAHHLFRQTQAHRSSA